MIESVRKNLPRCLVLLISFLFLCSLIACGNDENTGEDSDSNATSSPSITLTVPNVTYGTSVTAYATVKNAGGTAVQGVVVNFSESSGLVAFTPTSATALTNASGVAAMTVNAADMNSAGATNIYASASVIVSGSATTITSAPVGISVSGATITLGTLTVGTSPISAYGTSSLSVPVLINNSAATVPVSVTFTSLCGATLSSPVTSSAGTAVSTYKDNGCASGTTTVVDTITASVAGGATASANITIQPTLVNNIQFVSAEPEIIGIKGTGSATLPQTSKVTFKVVDNSNTGKAGVLVDFSLLPATVPGGVSFSPASATSGSDGTVTTTVTSGTTPTPVWVVATVDSNPEIKSQSNKLTITTGLPTQNRFSLSVLTHNIEAWEYDGVPAALTVYAFDRLGNSVPDGTAVNFISEGAGITPASCETKGGTCEVTFLSGNPRSNGRLTVLAYAVGEESFVDLDGDNAYDSGETFYSLGDLYIDADESGSWNSGEQYFAPYASEGSAVCSDNALSKQNTCDAAWSTNYVRQRNLIILSSSSPGINSATFSMSGSCIKTFPILLYDINGNPMPAGTKVSTDDNYVSYTAKDATSTSKATVSITGGSPVPDRTSPGYIALTVEADCSKGTPNAYPAGTVNVVITSPRGLITKIPFTIN